MCMLVRMWVDGGVYVNADDGGMRCECGCGWVCGNG